MSLIDKKIKSFLSKKKWQKLTIVVFALFLLVFIIILIFLNNIFSQESLNKTFVPDLIKENNQLVSSESDCQDCSINPLTGEIQEEYFGYPLAVVIDNNIDARPPSGINKADIVYEVPVEGGITRYLAVFNSVLEIDKIGPIRSARPYILDFSEELSSLFVHCGGSPQALMQIAQNDIFNMNEFYNGDYFYRDRNKPVPHNIYTDSESLRKYLQDNKKEDLDISSWKFKVSSYEEEVDVGNLSQVIDIDYLANAHKVEWVYDWQEQNYVRHLNEVLHEDDKGNKIRAKNIIIRQVESEVLDEKLRLAINTKGEGEAVICAEAVCKKGKWKKEDSNSRTYYYVDGKEFIFEPGNFWIEVVDQEVDFSY